MNYNSNDVEKFRRERNKWLKKYFNNSRIKLNYIIEILRDIERQYRINYFKWFELPNNIDKIVTMNFDSPDYIICKHIIGTYKSLTLFKAVDERKELESSESFKKKLIEEVVFKLDLNKYSKNIFRKEQLFAGDSFIYFSIPYYVFTICVYLLSKINQNSIYLSLRIKILESIFAILDLMENNIIDMAYPICRGLIETYIKYLCLLGKPEALEMRDELVDEEINYNVCANNFSKKFIIMYNNKNGVTNNKLHFLHYGFVDKINDYYDVINKNDSPYSITSILKYIKRVIQRDKIENVEILERYYHMCHTYVHGNCNNAYPLNGYLELSEVLYIVTIDIFKSVCNEMKEDYTIDGMNIIKHMEESYDSLQEQMENRKTELFDEYYKNQ